MTHPVSNPQDGGWRRFALWPSAAVFVLVWAAVAVAGPETVAGHVGPGGEVTRWDSKWELLTVFGLTAAGIVIAFGGMGWLLARIPASAVNLPNRRRKEYWTRPENRDRLNRMLSEDMGLIGAATLLLMAWLLVVLTRAGDHGTDTWALLGPVLIFLAAVIAYTIHLAVGSRYAIPGE